MIVCGQGNFSIDDKGKRHLAALGWATGSDLWFGHADHVGYLFVQLNQPASHHMSFSPSLPCRALEAYGQLLEVEKRQPVYGAFADEQNGFIDRLGQGRGRFVRDGEGQLAALWRQRVAVTVLT